MPTFESMAAGYRNLWRAATIKPGTDDSNATTFAGKIIAAEARYRAAQAATGVPWFFIGALHMRESSCNFDGVLHNGEKIIGTGRLTSLVPAGRGPFTTWEESAADALRLKNLHRVQEWTIERMLYHAEEFNGWGYVGKGVNSPYIWAGTSLEQTGKYVADHVWSSTFDDPQLGVSAVLKRLAELRPDIAAALASPQVAEPAPSTVPEVLPPEVQAMPEIATIIRQFAPLVLFLLVKDSLSPTDRDAMLQRVLQQVTGGMVTLPATEAPAPVVVPVPVPTPTPATTPVTPADKKTVGVSLIGLVLSALGMATGVIGTPFEMGADPTAAGTAAITVPLVTAIAGATGLASPLVGIGVQFLSAFVTALAARPKK